VHAPGYRTFKTGLAIINGGRGLEIGTQRLTGSVPYLSRASLNDWDILYTKNEFRTFEYNDWNHEFVFEFENLDTTPLAVRLVDNSNKVYIQNSLTPTKSNVILRFKDFYLQKGNKACLAPGASYLIQYTQNGVEYEVPISLVVGEAKGKVEDPKTYDAIYDLSPLTSIAKLFEFTVPDFVPFFKGGKVKLFPQVKFPINLQIDPPGNYYAISISLNGETEDDPFMPQHRHRRQFRIARTFRPHPVLHVPRPRLRQPRRRLCRTLIR
jgi:hypothetical protein